MNQTSVAQRPTMPIVDTHPVETERAEFELAFVLPCLNEANSLAGCIRAAQECIAKNGLAAEIILADNGSTDGSQEIARRMGARVVDIKVKGYGSALAGGIAAARSKYIIMGDSDMSYDFGEAMKFLDKLRAGADFVMGNRFKGGIDPGAMPPLHRYFGTPFLSMIGKILFRFPVGDVNCGMRAFSKDAFIRMDVRTPGMEFASELIIKCQLHGLRFAEVPITLHKDQRGRPPHLRSFRDGWRHLRFMLAMSPRWTLLFPGLALATLGAILMALVAPGPFKIGGVYLDIHTLIAASLMLVLGYQFAVTAAAMRRYTMAEEVGPVPELLEKAYGIFTLERGVVAGVLGVLAGLALVAVPTVQWAQDGFGTGLHTPVTLRYMIIGSTLVALGTQTVLMSFVMSMFSIKYRRKIQ